MQHHDVNASGIRSRTYPYTLRNIPAGQRELVDDMTEKFIGETIVVQETSAPEEYQIHSPYPLDDQQYEKLQQLCRLSAREKPPQPNKTPQESSESKGKAPVTGKDKRRSLAATPPKNRPDTLRIKNIPKDYTISQVEGSIGRKFKSVAKVHSLAALNADYNCATATFPNEVEYDFPNIQLERIRLDGNSVSNDPFDYDTEFKGLTPLYDAGEQASVDIVAVVGLGSHPFATFRSPEPKSDGMWLRDFLPQDIEHIRVILYGYLSRVDSSRSIETIEDIAKTLLNRLTHFRRATSTQKRPLILLGQSLGGLIVQECLVLSDPESRNRANLEEADPEATMIFDSWCGLVGFGIPIAGLNNPTLLAAVQGQPNQTLMNQLCANEEGEPSEYLQGLRARFEQCRLRRSRDYAPRILYFWEMLLSYPKLREGTSPESTLMVPPNSSTPGAQNFGLDSDHSGMVKYKNRGDELYEDVRNNMKKMIQQIEEK
ncbi:hypothetical protein F5882DRAFT_417648 [Hyaloscypha sp. PMI_1271]|nr:hypothetical protein F5882DRAFT_417648 [Hyaloscypha sp. PMI_1271]